MIFRPLIDIIKYPIITEKTTLLIESNQYSFAVDRKADKASIKAAIEQLFDVKVVSVNTLSQPSKFRRGATPNSTRTLGKKANYKKAIIKLAPENSINLFEDK